MEQICMAMSKFENIAALRIRQSLRKTNDDDKLRGGSGRRANAVMVADAVHYLDQAADFYAQVSLQFAIGIIDLILVKQGTAQQCLRLGNLRAANQVQSEFRIPERRFCWLKVNCVPSCAICYAVCYAIGVELHHLPH